MIQSILIIFLKVIIVILAANVLFLIINRISYVILKNRIIRKQKWGLNICCGKTDGGGVNADIVKHSDDVKNYVQVDNLYNLPFENNEFDSVLCSHTIEHIDDPARFDAELRRVGGEVVYILPPIWDIWAIINIFEHKWIFLTFTKRHTSLPKYIPMPFSRAVQRLLGQRVVA